MYKTSEKCVSTWWSPKRGFEQSRNYAIVTSCDVDELSGARSRRLAKSSDAGNADSGLEITIIMRKTHILTKNTKLKKQRKYLAHCDAQLIFAANFSTAPVTN